MCFSSNFHRIYFQIHRDPSRVVILRRDLRLEIDESKDSNEFKRFEYERDNKCALIRMKISSIRRGFVDLTDLVIIRLMN